MKIFLIILSAILLSYIIAYNNGYSKCKAKLEKEFYKTLEQKIDNTKKLQEYAKELERDINEIVDDNCRFISDFDFIGLCIVKNKK